MSCLRTLSSRSLVTIFCLLITHAANAAQPTPVDCEAALDVTPTKMDFGSYVDGTGTIIMDIATGNMTHSAGLIPVPSSATVGTRASFSLTTTLPQCKQKEVIFTMPPGNSFDMTGPGSTVTIDNLVNDLPAATFKVGNGYTIMMAGILNATAGDATGTYNGGFNVTFTYVPF